MKYLRNVKLDCKIYSCQGLGPQRWKRLGSSNSNISFNKLKETTNNTMDQRRNSVHLDNEQNELKDLNTQDNELNANTCNLIN